MHRLEFKPTDTKYQLKVNIYLDNMAHALNEYKLKHVQDLFNHFMKTDPKLVMIDATNGKKKIQSLNNPF